jgi:hypothetical protein
MKKPVFIYRFGSTKIELEDKALFAEIKMFTERLTFNKTRADNGVIITFYIEEDVIRDVFTKIKGHYTDCKRSFFLIEIYSKRVMNTASLKEISTIQLAEINIKMDRSRTNQLRLDVDMDTDLRVEEYINYSLDELLDIINERGGLHMLNNCQLDQLEQYSDQLRKNGL